MTDYSKSKIYKIVCNKTGLIYYGSTTKKINTRLKEHEARFKKNNGGKYTCYKILENNDYKIELVEDVRCETKNQLREREAYYIRNYDCINKVIPGRTRKERDNLPENKLKKAKHDKKYWEKNKEKIKEKNKINSIKHNKIRNEWNKSMGGSPYKDNNSLLKIDVNLFF